eukprot:2010457-Pyramimonas_sp.AAC.1
MKRFEGDEGLFLTWGAFMAFLPGAHLVYAGQEAGTDHLPSLFDLDPVHWCPPEADDGSSHCDAGFGFPYSVRAPDVV